MKRRMLIVGITMALAGTEKSFLNFIKNIDRNEWDITLLLAKKTGRLLNEIPDYVTVNEIDKYGEIFLLDKSNYKKIIINNYLKANPLNLFKIIPDFFRILFSKTDKKTYAKNRLWLKLMNILPEITDEYDLTISYWGDRTLFYVNRKVKYSGIKYTWLHFDYDFHNREDLLYLEEFDKCDKIICVSEIISDKLKVRFPVLKDKILTFENIVDYDDVINKSREEVELVEKSILTVGRVVFDKGYDLALESIKSLKNKYNDFKWYIIGNYDTPYGDMILAKIKEYGLVNQVILLGEKDNPYKYIRKAKIYFQPSRTEADPIVIKEAKILGKTIIASNISTMEFSLKNYNNCCLIDITKDYSDILYKYIKNNNIEEYKIRDIENNYNIICKEKIKELLY